MTAIVVLENKALKRAMVINSRIKNPFMTGVIMERISELKRRMQREVVEIEFRKKDGSITRRFATTMDSLAKQHINGDRFSIKVPQKIRPSDRLYRWQETNIKPQ